MAELMTRIVLRNDSTANWTANKNTVLYKGEMGIEFNPAPADTQTRVPEIKIKIGDGITTWENLPYATLTPDEINSLITSKLGEIPKMEDEDGNDITPSTIVDFIIQKTTGIATSGNITAIEGRLNTLEAIKHTHDNKDELDKINDGAVAKWDAATDKINNLEIPTGSTVYQNTSLDNIAKDGLNNGDFAIIETVISGDIKSRTAYVWDVTIPVYELNEDGSFKLNEETNEKIIKSYGDWVAFDGNYSANNVYLANNLKLAGNFSSIGNYNKNDTITAGTSLAEILSTMMQAPLATSKTDPSIDITNRTTNYADQHEVGTIYTLPTARLTVTTGSYSCDGVTDYDTGVEYAAEAIKLAYDNINTTDTKKFIKNNAKITDTTATKYIELAPADYNYANTDENGNVITQATLKDSADKDVYKFYASAAHGEADKSAVNNLGQSTSTKIAANSNLTDSLTVSCYGYRKIFMGTVENKADVTSDIVRNLKNLQESGDAQKGYKAGAMTKTLKIPVGAMRVIIAVPSSYKVKECKDVNGFNTDLISTGGMNKLSNTVAVKGANNYTAINYDIYYKDFADPNDTENKYTVVISAK